MKRLITIISLAICFYATSSYSEQQAKLETAVLAGGCFWCIEADLDKLDGVISTISGYTGGNVKDPSYKEVSAGGTGHYEALKVEFDSNKISYSKLLDYFWRHIDPTDGGGQFCDRGDQYRSAIFASTSQRDIAEASKRKLQEANILKSPIATEILPLSTFYPAEDYHQDYYKKNPIRYRFYRFSCGRDQKIEDIWEQK